MSDDYYVYELAYPKSMGGAAFYMGKGHGDRWLAHEREAREGIQSRKCDVIRSIWAHGEQVERRKVQEHLTEEEAFTLEARLINSYGIANLTNEDRGCWYYLPTEEHPVSRKDMEQYALTWQGSQGERIRVEARKHYLRIQLKNKPIVQVFNIRDISTIVGKENITPEQESILAAKQAKFRADFPPSRPSFLHRIQEDSEAIIL